MKTFVLFVIAGLVTGKTLAQTDSSDYVVIPYNAEIHKHLWFGNGKPTTLSKEEIAELQSLTEKNLHNYQIQERNEIRNNASLSANPNGFYSFNGNASAYQTVMASTKKDVVIPNVQTSIDDYYQQYIPVMNEKGEKEVFVNWLSKNTVTNGNWRQELVWGNSPWPADAFKNRFFLKINLKSKACYNINDSKYLWNNTYIYNNTR